MGNPTNVNESEIWADRFKRNGKDIFKNTLLAGGAIFATSYGGLFLAIKFFPSFFLDYINPIFNSDGSRDIHFYLHPFMLALALSVFWNRFRKVFLGHQIKIGIEFGLVYAFVALVPILWLTYSTIDVSLQMVMSWLAYGLFQACIAGIVFAYISPFRAIK